MKQKKIKLKDVCAFSVSYECDGRRLIYNLNKVISCIVNPIEKLLLRLIKRIEGEKVK